MYDCIIVGGGLSGLAAAVELAERGARVALFERAPKLGGRCYSYRDERTGDLVDNGQHVLVGAYHNTLRYLELIGSRHFLKEQSKLFLPLYHPTKGFGSFRVSSLPRPFDLTAAMLQFSFLSFRDRQKLLRIGMELQRWDETVKARLSLMTVDDWLESLEQSDEAKQCLWYPIAISMMNEQPARASALLFAGSLRRAFLGKKSDAAILIPSTGQTELYVSGAVRLLKKYHAALFINSEVAGIDVTGSAVTGVFLKNGKKVRSHALISAVPYFALPRLLPRNVRSHRMFAQLAGIRSSPIVSIHLWFDVPIMEMEYVGVVGKRLQWIFNRRKIFGEDQKRDAYISAVISGASAYAELDKAAIIAIAMEDIDKIFPASRNAQLIHAVVIKEKRATFSPTNDIELLRPQPETMIENFFLAGDWVSTGLPATIEGAVFSGFRAAKLAR